MARQRFGRGARLCEADAFQAAFERGRRINEKWLAALVLAQPGGEPRLGLAVPKKIAARANTRNRIKRQVRESFRLNRHRLPPADIVVLARPGSPGATRAQLHTTLERLWERIAESASSPPPSSS